MSNLWWKSSKSKLVEYKKEEPYYRYFVTVNDWHTGTQINESEKQGIKEVDEIDFIHIIIDGIF